jgi:sugar (pentulose or hexulose) kinase
MNDMKSRIDDGAAVLGIELGSTRIKAVLIGPGHEPVASGSHSWENSYEGGYWTYSLGEVEQGLRACYKDLANDVRSRYGTELKRVAALGVSAMMHGYLPFDADGNLLAPFRTWRNTNTGRAAAALTELFGFNIPHRWSIAHLYQAMLDGEPHVKDIAGITTLAGYVHRKLTGRNVLGVGDASGMFPIDSGACDYDTAMIEKFDGLTGADALSLLPAVLTAGADAGVLTPEGALWLDPTGNLEPGAPACPPEGDAGTGMVATDSVAVRTGNISAGTSIFAMIVLEKPLSKLYPEIDMVTTPSGSPVAMVHCNNGTSDIDAWAGVFRGFAEAAGAEIPGDRLYEAVYGEALKGDADAGGLLLYNYLAGEPVTGTKEGRPLLVRAPDSRLSFRNLARAHLYSAVATLKLGMGILDAEDVAIDRIVGHGGFFKTAGAGQQVAADALGTPVSVLATAGEGGAWGIALLAAYRAAALAGSTASLGDFLADEVFARMERSSKDPDPAGTRGFAAWLERYERGIAVEHAAAEYV